MGALEEISVLARLILDHGERREVDALLVLVAGLHALAKIRAHELHPAPLPAPARDLTVKEAVSAYPISRSFLYERGEKLGVAHRTPHGRLIVIESALRAYLEGRR